MVVRPLLTLTALSIATVAQAQAPSCIPAQEAEALVLAVAPTLVGSVATMCAPRLPANATLRRSVGPLTAKFAREADAAWPVAKRAIARVIGAANAPMLESELARPMLTSMAAPLLAKEVKPADCPNIDRILTLVDPLPARNAAGLVVAIVEMSGRDANAGDGRRFAVCPTTGRP